MDTPQLARVIEKDGKLQFVCGDCGAEVMDLRNKCHGCRVALSGLLVDSSAEEWMKKMGGSSRQMFLEGSGLIHIPLDLEWLFSARRG